MILSRGVAFSQTCLSESSPQVFRKMVTDQQPDRDHYVEGLKDFTCVQVLMPFDAAQRRNESQADFGVTNTI
jgi:hypothetical protein